MSGLGAALSRNKLAKPGEEPIVTSWGKPTPEQVRWYQDSIYEAKWLWFMLTGKHHPPGMTIKGAGEEP